MIGSITIQQEQPLITIAQEAPPVITIQQEQPLITIAQEAPPVITIQQNLGIPVTIQGGSIVEMSTFLPFSVTATTNGQTVFTLPYTYTSIICLFIMGTGQDPIAGDYTVNGNVVTLGLSAPSIQAGDLIFGSGQI